MKKFLKFCILFISPIVIIIITSEILLRKIPNDYSYKKNFLDKNSNNIKMLFLGSSHTYFGINPEYVKSNSFNAGNSSQSLDYDLEILMKYEGKWDSLKYIVVPVDYFSLFGKLETSIESWRVKDYDNYCGIKTNNGIIDNIEILSNKLLVNQNKIKRYYLKNVSGVTCSDLGWGMEYNSKNNQDLMVSGKAAAKRHLAKNNQYFDENVKVLKSIIKFAKANKSRVFFYTSPAYKTYVQNLDNDQLNNTVRTLRRMADSYNNVIYFNFINDNEFTKKDFYDADHLNEIGARKLTLKIDRFISMSEK
jgi:hypothetical protein